MTEGIQGVRQTACRHDGGWRQMSKCLEASPASPADWTPDAPWDARPRPLSCHCRRPASQVTSTRITSPVDDLELTLYHSNRSRLLYHGIPQRDENRDNLHAPECFHLHTMNQVVVNVAEQYKNELGRSSEGGSVNTVRVTLLATSLQVCRRVFLAPPTLFFPASVALLMLCGDRAPSPSTVSGSPYIHPHLNEPHALHAASQHSPFLLPLQLLHHWH